MKSSDAVIHALLGVHSFQRTSMYYLQFASSTSCRVHVSQLSTHVNVIIEKNRKQSIYKTAKN